MILVTIWALLVGLVGHRLAEGRGGTLASDPTPAPILLRPSCRARSPPLPTTPSPVWSRRL